MDPARPDLPQGVRLTPLDPAFREDPYPILHDLRRRAPVFRDTDLKHVVATRHDDVQRVLRDRDLFVDPRKARPGDYSRLFLRDGEETEPSLLFLDDPDHQRLRGLVSRAFTPRAVEAMRPAVRKLAAGLLDSVDAEEFDLIGTLAGPLPASAIALMLGVEEAFQERFKRWSEVSTGAFFNPFADPAERARGREANRALGDYFLGEIARRREAPRDDLIGRLCQAQEDDGDRLSGAEIVSLCNLLLVAGNVTTTDLIGNGVKALLEHPRELDKLRADRSLVPRAVEEMLRYDSPVMVSGRIAPRDLELGGVRVEEGESITTVLGAANRDPDVYPEPDRFDVTREDVHHQAFGGGSHLCLGAHLARLEAQEAVAALLDRFPRLSRSERPHVYRRVPGFRGVERYFIRAG